MHQPSDFEIEKELKKHLEKVDTPATRAVLNDVDALSFSVSMTTSTLKLASSIAAGNSGAALSELVDRSATTADLATKASGNENAKLASTSFQIFLQSASLMSLTAKTHPAAVMATAGAMLAKKTSLALGMASNDKQAKVIAAYADLAANLLTTGVSVAAAVGSGGLASALAVGAASQLILSAYSAYEVSTEDS